MRSVELLRHFVAYTYGEDTQISLHFGDDLTELSYKGYERQTVNPDQWDIIEDISGESMQISVYLDTTVTFQPNRENGVVYDRVGLWSGGELRYVFRLDYPVDLTPDHSGIRAPSFLPGDIVNVEMQ